MNAFTRWMSLLFAVCLLGVSGTRALARRDPPADVARLLPDEGCPAPCWAGLRPGQLSGETLQAWLTEPPTGWHAERANPPMAVPGVIEYWKIAPPAGAPFVLGTVRVHEPGADALHLLPADLTLGEAVAALGAPDYVLFGLGPDRPAGPTLQYQAVFRGGYLAVTGLIPAGASHLAVSAPVEALVYRAVPAERSVLAHDWRGFGPMVRYYPQGAVP